MVDSCRTSALLSISLRWKAWKKDCGALSSASPLAALYKISGKERYKKALNTIKESFFYEYRLPDLLPTSRAGRDPDVKDALFLANAVLALVYAGLKLNKLLSGKSNNNLSEFLAD